MGSVLTQVSELDNRVPCSCPRTIGDLLSVEKSIHTWSTEILVGFPLVGVAFFPLPLPALNFEQYALIFRMSHTKKRKEYDFKVE